MLWLNSTSRWWSLEVLWLPVFDSYTRVTLKPTVGRPKFFMLIGRQTRFWSANWSCHIKNIPHRFTFTDHKVFHLADRHPMIGRPSAYYIFLSGNMQRVGRWSADLRATAGRPIIWHFCSHAHATVAWSSPKSWQTVARRWTGHQNPKKRRAMEKKI